MKRLFAIAISLCAAVALIPAAALANAEEREAYYPELDDQPLSFSSLADFAHGEDESFAFAVGSTIIRLDGEIRTDYVFGSPVSDIDYSAESGAYYFKYAERDEVYKLPENNAGVPEKSDFAMQSVTLPFTYNNVYTYNIDGGSLNIWDGTASGLKSVEGDFVGLKIYNSQIYAYGASGVFEVNSNEVERINFTFSNYNLLEAIPVGSAYKKLQTFESNPRLATVEGGHHATAFDANLLESGGVFPITDGRGSTRDDVSGTALLLCQAGDASIIAIGGQCYILSSSSVNPSMEITLESAEGSEATVNAPDYAYAAPYVCNATRTFKTSAGEKVTVLKKLSKESFPQLLHDFYLIENAEGERGYLASEFVEINSPVFNENAPSTLPEKNPQTGDYVKTVVLVLVVIVLVLVGVGYLTWVGASGKHKKIIRKDDVNEDGGEQEKGDGES